MRKIRARVEGIASGTRILPRDTSRYLVGSLRLGPGHGFVAFDGGSEAEATIGSIEAGVVEVTIGPVTAALRAARPIVWLQALAKNDKCDAIVRDVTELGATRFVPVRCARSVTRLEGPRAEERRRRWERIAREAARQSGRAEVPEVLGPAAWGDAIASVPPTFARFCLFEGATHPLAVELAPSLAAGVPLAFAVGPEGGLDPEEVEVAAAAGWHVVSLGATILRTETVAAAVLGAVTVFGGVEDSSPRAHSSPRD